MCVCLCVRVSFLFILEKPAKRRKGKKVRALFQKVCKAVNHTFLPRNANRMDHLTSHPDPNDSELTPDPGLCRTTPVADTDTADPEPLCVPGPSRIEQVPDVDLADPESSPVADPSNSDLGNSESLSLWFKLFLPSFVKYLSLSLLAAVILIQCK